MSMNIYIYSVGLWYKENYNWYEIKATSKLEAVMKAVENYGPVEKILSVSRVH